MQCSLIQITNLNVISLDSIMYINEKGDHLGFFVVGNLKLSVLSERPWNVKLDRKCSFILNYFM